MVRFKNKNIRGQYSGTRSRAVIDRIHERVHLLAQKYRVARNAKLQLSGPDPEGWELTLLPLLDSDIRSYSDPDHLPKHPGRRGTVEDDVVAATSDVLAEESEDGTGIDLLPEQRTTWDGTGET
jgi:hypothetical protein